MIPQTQPRSVTGSELTSGANPSHSIDYPAIAISLPPELLSWMFEIACRAVATSPEGTSISAAITSILNTRSSILAICSFWRNVALVTTGIWRTVVVRRKRTATDRTGWQSMLLGLERSGRRTISLYFPADLHMDGVMDSLPLLQPHLHRFRRILAPHNSPLIDYGIGRLFASVPGDNSYPSPLPAPHLDSLVLAVRQQPTSVPEKSIDLTGLGELRHLWLEYHLRPGAFVRVHTLSVTKLTRLYLNASINASDTVHLVEHSPCLEVLYWKFWTVRSPGPTSLPSQNTLRHLHLIGDLPSQLLISFEFPNVEHLGVDLALTPEAARSRIHSVHFPKLNTLNLSLGLMRETGPGILTNFLNENRLLHKIVLPWELDNDLIKCLTESTSQSLVPKLTEVWVDFYPAEARNVDRLLAAWEEQELYRLQPIVLYVHSLEGVEDEKMSKQSWLGNHLGRVVVSSHSSLEALGWDVILY